MKFINIFAPLTLLVTPAFAALKVTYSDVSGLKFRATVTSDTGITILKHPYSVAAPEFETDIFTFESKDGNTPAFSGISLKWDSKSSEKIELKANGSIAFGQDISKTYKFSGKSTYKIGGGNIFYVLSPSGDVSMEVATVVSTTAKLSGGAKTRKRAHTPVYGSHDKLVTFNGCNAAQRSVTNTAAGVAQKYITASRDYLAQHTTSTPRWAWWFGPHTSTRQIMVRNHYANMVGDPFNIRYDCITCPFTHYRHSYAYVHPTEPSTIYLCAAYWHAPISGTDSKAGTIVHVLSHLNANGGTYNYAFGQTAAHALALPPPAGNPAKAIMNADSHEYFAENTPFRA